MDNGLPGPHGPTAQPPVAGERKAEVGLATIRHRLGPVPTASGQTPGNARVTFMLAKTVRNNHLLHLLT